MAPDHAHLSSLPTRPGPDPVAGAPEQPEPATRRHADDRRASAGEFLHRREVAVERQPASWGWRGALTRWSGGVVQPARGRAERRHDDDRSSVQREFDGPRTIVFLNPKGGAAKTTSVLAAGYTFGTVRGGGVVAWDNNETRGTLGLRAVRGNHHNTTRELLDDLDRFATADARIGDLASFVRSQGDAHFDVLASDERPGVTGIIHAQDFTDVHRLLERFYRLILVDTGNNMRAENWLAAAEAADLLVVTSTVREDTGYSGLWMLDALHDAGYPNLKYRTVTVLSDPSDRVDGDLVHDLVEVYGQRTRAVHRVPFDPALVSGSVLPYGELSRATTRAWLSVCASMAAAL
jgi:MinD-like ATPase involved in chromosome partitioning or flagellar assembly